MSFVSLIDSRRNKERNKAASHNGLPGYAGCSRIRMRGELGRPDRPQLQSLDHRPLAPLPSLAGAFFRSRQAAVRVIPAPMPLLQQLLPPAHDDAPSAERAQQHAHNNTPRDPKADLAAPSPTPTCASLMSPALADCDNIARSA